MGDAVTGGGLARARPVWLHSVTAACLLSLCAWLRPDVAIGLVVLGAVFIVLERRWPVVQLRVLRRGWSVDVVHFVVDQVLAGAVVAGLAYVLVPYLEPVLPNFDTLLAGWVSLGVAALVGEVFGYWGHRMMHRVPILWRLHAVHHSSPVMDWLAPNRRHVLDTALGQAASAIPLLALGLSPPLVVSAFVLRRAQGLFVHANVRVHLPGVRWVIATPEFHHWHHSADPAHYDCNFAGQCPALDGLFGTLHMPARVWPDNYGLAAGTDVAPPSYLGRLWWPFSGLGSTMRRRPTRVAVGLAAACALMSSAVVAASALEPEPMVWSYQCIVDHGDAPPGLEIGAAGVVLIDGEGDRDVTTVRNTEGDPLSGVGIRLVLTGASPMTVRVGPGSVGAVVAVSVVGAGGTSTGTCVRGPDRPAG